MVDTAIVRFPVSISAYQKSKTYRIIKETPKNERFTKNIQQFTMPNGATLNMCYYSANDQFRAPSLNFQVSLPKVLFGNNVQMITKNEQILEACEIINDYATFFL